MGLEFDLEIFMQVGALAAGAVAIITLYKKIQPWLIALLERVALMFKTGDIIKGLSTLESLVNEVRAEVKPNGGTSLRDAVQRIEVRQVLAEQRHLAIMTDMPQGIMEANEVGEVVWVNRQIVREVGRVPEELTGLGWINMIAQEYREEVREAWLKAIEEEREFHRVITVETPNGITKQLQMNTVRMYDDSDTTLGWVIMINTMMGV